MNGCRCDCGGGGRASRFALSPPREEQIERLEEYQRDLEQRVAEVADEIRRLRETPQPAT